MEINLDVNINEETDRKKLMENIRKSFGKTPKIRTLPIPRRNRSRKRRKVK